MRGTEKKQATMLTLLSPERCVPQKHPLRAVKALADAALRELSPVFDEMYSAIGRPSIPPERLLKSTLLMAFYSVRSETLFCEQLSYNLLFRWFLDMNMDEESFVQETFSKNRERLMKHNVASLFFGKVVEQARAAGLMSDEHFTVDGTLIEAWASLKSFRPKEEKPEDRPPPDDKGNPTVDFHGEKRSNQTHQSTTDPESRLARKGRGKEAKLSYAQHALMENRNGLLVELQITEATGTAEREAALSMVNDYLPRDQRITLAGDKGFDTRGFVEGCRELGVTPHVAQNLERSGGSAVDKTHHSTSGLLGEPADPQTSRRDLRLDQDGGELPEDAIQRTRSDAARLVPGRRCVQLAADGQAARAGRGLKHDDETRNATCS